MSKESKKNEIHNCAEAVKFAFTKTWAFGRKFMFLAAFSSLVATVLPFVNIFGIRYIIQEITTTQRFESAVAVAVIMFCLNFILKELNIYVAWRRSLNFIALQDSFYRINSEKIMKMDFECLENPSTLDKITNMWATETVAAQVIEKVFQLLFSSIGLFGSVAIIATLDPVFIVLLLIFIFAVSYVNGKAAKKAARLDIESAPAARRGEYLNAAAQNTQTGKEIRTFLAYSFFLEKITKNIAEVHIFEKKRNSTNLAFQLFSVFVGSLQTALMYGYMSLEFISGAISISSFSMYLGATVNFADCISKMSNAFTDISSRIQHIDKFNEYHKLPEKLRESAKENVVLPNRAFTLEFKDVSFKYPGAAEYVLQNVSFFMEKAQTFSIIGKNGAGKTTLVKLICRLYDPTEGAILINGTNIKDYPYDNYMRFIGTVFQDFKLFTFSIRDNLDMNGEKTDQEIFEAIEKSNVSAKVDSLPQKLDTYIIKGNGFDAVELSGGEYQKLAIARTYLKNGRMVILDEPTAAVDPISEQAIYKSFNELVEDKNALYISHRLSSAKFSDRILYMDDKTVAETGTHDELIALNGGYAELYRAQSAYYGTSVPAVN